MGEDLNAEFRMLNAETEWRNWLMAHGRPSFQVKSYKGKSYKVGAWGASCRGGKGAFVRTDFGLVFVKSWRGGGLGRRFFAVGMGGWGWGVACRRRRIKVRIGKRHCLMSSSGSGARREVFRLCIEFPSTIPVKVDKQRRG